MAHPTFAELAADLVALPPPGRDTGRIELVVVRPSPGERRTPERVRLTVDGGVDGDRWAARVPTIPAAQITVMRADVARVLGGGQPLALFGDNLLVHLDLSPTNLPLATRLRVGTAVCVVTEKPHNGCAKFEERFGADARAIMAAETYRADRLRGLYIRVVDDGEVGPGDAITIIDRPPIPG